MLVTIPQIRDVPLNCSFRSLNTGVDCGDVEHQSSEGYVVLPGKYFNKEHIPPPLVSKLWLELLTKGKESSDCESEDDGLSLQELRNRWKKNYCEDETQGSSKETNLPIKKQAKKIRKQKSTEFSPINRKRGRPRKVKETETEIQQVTVLDEIDTSSKSEDEFWSDVNVPDVREETHSEEDNLVAINCREHDYFKQVNSEQAKEKQNEKKENKDFKIKKRKKKTAIEGVKVEDSKTCYPCLECGKSFSAASTLKNHLRIHNGSLLVCTECHKGFTTKYLLKCHMRLHSGDLFMCHKCGKGFTTAELLKVHSRGHTGDRPFVCNVCKKTFPSASNLSQHKQTHYSEKKYLCFQCGSSFSQKRCLDGHMLTHAEKNHICTVCGKLWARKSDLSEHMRVHTGVKPYCCNICPQKFTQASSLKRHQIVHMDTKPIQCLTCNKMFKCQEYYKRHMRKHEREADYLFNTNKE